MSSEQEKFSNQPQTYVFDANRLSRQTDQHSFSQNIGRIDTEDEKRGIISTLEQLMRQEFRHEGTGHDWLHTASVRNMALYIAGKELGEKDMFVIEVAALLHDYKDWKLQKGEVQEKPDVGTLLKGLGVDAVIAEQIVSTISTVSYKGETAKSTLSIEAKIVQDADRLEALGAVGVARAIAYGGSIGRIIDDPSIPPKTDITAQEYQSKEYLQGENETTFNHFYEKLFKLPQDLNTATAKELAKERIAFMHLFLDTFHAERNIQFTNS